MYSKSLTLKSSLLLCALTTACTVGYIMKPIHLPKTSPMMNDKNIPHRVIFEWFPPQ